MMDVGTQLRLLARLALTVRFHQAQSGLLNLIVTAEKLPDSVLRHFFTVQIALLLNATAEILLQRAGKLQAMILLQQPGGAAFTRLAVYPNHSFVTAADIGRVEWQIGDLPLRFLMLAAVSESLLNRILMRAGKSGKYQLPGIGMTGMNRQFIAVGHHLNNPRHITKVQSRRNALGIKI